MRKATSPDIRKVSKTLLDAECWAKIRRADGGPLRLLESNLDDDIAIAPLIARERERFAQDLLDADEFESRVEAILRGEDCWWECVPTRRPT